MAEIDQMRDEFNKAYIDTLTTLKSIIVDDQAEDWIWGSEGYERLLSL